MRVKWYLILVLICVSLMTNALEFFHGLVYHWCICFGEMFIQVYCFIFIWLILCPFVLSLQSVFNIYILVGDALCFTYL